MLERLSELRKARDQNEGGETGFTADLGRALSSEMPEAIAAALEAEKADDPDRRLAAIARHETSIRNGIQKTLAMLHALEAHKPGKS